MKRVGTSRDGKGAGCSNDRTHEQHWIQHLNNNVYASIKTERVVPYILHMCYSITPKHYNSLEVGKELSK